MSRRPPGEAGRGLGCGPLRGAGCGAALGAGRGREGGEQAGAAAAGGRVGGGGRRGAGGLCQSPLAFATLGSVPDLAAKVLATHSAP